jgi:hypothetical protein
MTAARDPMRGSPSSEMTAMSTPMPSQTTTDRDREAATLDRMRAQTTTERDRDAATRDRMRAQTGDPDTARDHLGGGLAALTEVTHRSATPMPAPLTEIGPRGIGGPRWLARAPKWLGRAPQWLASRGRNATVIGALAGIAVLSFLIALAAKSCGGSAPAKIDASVVGGDAVALGTEGTGTNGEETNGTGTNGNGTNGTGVGTNGTGTNGTGVGTNGAGVGTNGTGVGTNGTGTNGAGLGTNGTGTNGTGTNGTGTNGTNGVTTDGGGPVLDPSHIELDPHDAGVLDAAREPTIRPDAGAPPTSVLEVRTQPTGGVVTVKGIDEVRIDPARFALEPGHYEVSAEFPGYLAEKREVVMERGLDVVQEIAFTRKKPGKQPPQTGKLTARTVPYSAVYMNGKLLGETPFAERALPVGNYTLTFKNPDKGTVTRKVKITANKTTKVNFTFP